MLEFDLTKPYRDQWGKGKGHQGDIGIEIEAELDRRFDPEEYSDYWTAKDDGSLRGHGVEFVLERPHKIDDVPMVMDDWKSWTKGSRAKKSPRTSVHVHFNMLGHTIPEILNFLGGFWLAEDWLMPFCGPSRRGNLFCLSGSRANNLPQNIISWLKTQQPTFRQWTDMEQAKYSSINPCTLPKFGSVEIRTMQGLYDKDLILQWIMELWKLKSHCVQFSNPKEFLAYYEGIPKLAWLREIFSKDFFRDIRKLHDGNGEWAGRMDAAYFDMLAMSNAAKDWKFKPKEVAKKAPAPFALGPFDPFAPHVVAEPPPNWEPRREAIIGGVNAAIIAGRPGWRAEINREGAIEWAEVFNPEVHLVAPVNEEPDNGWDNLNHLAGDDEPVDIGMHAGNQIDDGDDQLKPFMNVFFRNPLEGDI